MNEIESVKNISKIAFDFLQFSKVKELHLGRYELGNNVYANVEEYDTYLRCERQYEHHKKYIDVQVILEGEEIIEVAPVFQLQRSTEYDAKRDVGFFYNSVKGEQFLLSKGDFLVIYPGQAHMPCLQMNEEKARVKKMVIKIPAEELAHLLFMDVDGTLTDGMVYIGNDGEIAKAFNTKDGYAIANILPQKSIIPIIITGRKSRINEKRCSELGIEHIYQGVKDKLGLMISIANSYGLYENEKGIIPNTAYIGDDIPDLECIVKAERKGCPADAIDEVKKISEFISTKAGGYGAVREFIEWLSKNFTGNIK